MTYETTGSIRLLSGRVERMCAGGDDLRWAVRRTGLTRQPLIWVLISPAWARLLAERRTGTDSTSLVLYDTRHAEPDVVAGFR